MTGQTSPLDFYEPIDPAILPRSRSNAPQATPSIWSGIAAAFRTATDESDHVQDVRLTDGYSAIEADLVRLGVPLSSLRVPVEDIYQRGQVEDRNEGAVWAAMDAQRRRNPKLFVGLPKTEEEFRRSLLTRGGQRQRDQATLGRMGTAGSLTAGLVGGMGALTQDPLTATTLFAGGGGRTIGQAIVREAGVNAGMAAVLAPQLVGSRYAMGEDTGPGEIAANVAIGGVAGGALGGIGKGIELRLARTPEGQAAERFRREVPSERRTEAEATALRDVDRLEETVATNPFGRGAGTAEHIARVDRALETLRDPAPLTAVDRAQAMRVPKAAQAFSFQEWQERVGFRESGNRYAAQAETSTAYGRYQITRDTWVAIARKLPGWEWNGSDEQIWSKRTNQAAQDRVFRELTEQNRAALRRAGAPETYGNLYLMHFAGQGGAAKILRAAPDTPIEQLLSRKAIAANQNILRGKTAGDVIEWAARLMGEEPVATPRLAPEQFADAGELAAAQRALDEAEAAAQRARMPMERVRAEAVDVDDWMAGRVGMNWDADDVPVSSVQAEWRGTVERLRNDGGEAIGALRHPEVGEIDVKWGEVGERGGGWGLAKILQRHPEVVEDLPALIEDMRIKSQTPNRIVLESADHKAVVRLEFDGREQQWLLSAYSKEAKSPPATDYRRAADADRDGSPGREDSPEVLPTVDEGKAAQRLREQWDDAAIAGTAPEPTYILRPADGGEAVAFAPTRDALAEVADMTDADWEIALAYPPETADPPPIAGFDHADDAAANGQIDSLEHDLRMWLAEEEAAGATVRLSEDGDVISAADAMEDSDLDWAALDAAEACMRPGGDA